MTTEKVGPVSPHLTADKHSSVLGLYFKRYFELLGCGEPMDCESKMEAPGSPDREGGERDAGPEGMGDCDGLKGGADETEDSKKRKRKPYRPGKPPGMLDITPT